MIVGFYLWLPISLKAMKTRRAYRIESVTIDIVRVPVTYRIKAQRVIKVEGGGYNGLFWVNGRLPKTLEQLGSLRELRDEERLTLEADTVEYRRDG
ncbi:hypothetical protein A3K63_04905 [Candidatus Micrarchaeota archaeon RBG_16_49_10]|nr:MAG: hypothetical protein A3K63_04905 [Candidatus Micrarchaeota archaeon RBG_16_49_10]